MATGIIIATITMDIMVAIICKPPPMILGTAITARTRSRHARPAGTLTGEIALSVPSALPAA